MPVNNCTPINQLPELWQAQAAGAGNIRTITHAVPVGRVHQQWTLACMSEPKCKRNLFTHPQHLLRPDFEHL